MAWIGSCGDPSWLLGSVVYSSTNSPTAAGCQRGSHFLAGANPIKRPVQSCACDWSLGDRFSEHFGTRDPIAIFNQGNLIKILHRANTLRAAYRIFAAGRFLDPENIYTYIYIYISATARAYVAPATGMRKLSYSTSPRLTALVLCAPVDKHDRNNSEKKLSLTPGHVSALMAGIQSRQTFRVTRRLVESSERHGGPRSHLYHLCLKFRRVYFISKKKNKK